MTHRIIVGEELHLIREALAALCTSFGDVEVSATCGDGLAALDLIGSLKPDIALLDLGLPDLMTVDILRKLRASGSCTRVLVLASRCDRRTVTDTLRCGAAGYVLKSGSPEQLREALLRVGRGEIYVAPALEPGSWLHMPKCSLPAGPTESLSTREYQVFSLLVEGVRAKEIAARLNLSPKTVDTYRASLMRKLDIHDVAGLVRFSMLQDSRV